MCIRDSVTAISIGFISQVTEDTAGPAYRSSATNNGTGTSVTVSKPAGAVTGDLLVVGIVWDYNSGAPSTTPPDGTWTLAKRQTTSGLSLIHISEPTRLL